MGKWTTRWTLGEYSDLNLVPIALNTENFRPKPCRPKGFKVYGLGPRVEGSGLRVLGLGFRVYRVSGLNPKPALLCLSLLACASDRQM